MFRSYDHHQGAVFLCLAKVTLNATLKPVIKAKKCISLMMVLGPKHVGAVLVF